MFFYFSSLLHADDVRAMRIYCDICAHADWLGPISSNTHDINLFQPSPLSLSSIFKWILANSYCDFWVNTTEHQIQGDTIIVRKSRDYLLEVKSNIEIERRSHNRQIYINFFIVVIWFSQKQCKKYIFQFLVC